MHHTQALILRKDEWSEADWLVTALSRDFGKIRLRVQGARKHGAKLQGHIEPGSISELSFVSGRNSYRLTTARMVEHFPMARASLTKLGTLHLLLHLLDGNLLEERGHAEEIFSLTGKTLLALERGENPSLPRHLAIWFQAKFLDFLGVLPSIRSEEARRCALVLELSRIPLDEIERRNISLAPLELELKWLTRYLGDAVRMSPVVSYEFYAV